ncbi:hypothetical protein FCM35_KLT19402 [Carex littledalei]|uniref:Uncharacterized protein n=1 Tax=Carex littledalei TaxID=544730 RepID=A0A833RJ60_9POAL|nr:hypothetical protein FCM35_KLT19402 [Carex littledalei]
MVPPSTSPPIASSQRISTSTTPPIASPPASRYQSRTTPLVDLSTASDISTIARLSGILSRFARAIGVFPSLPYWMTMPEITSSSSSPFFRFCSP